MRKILLSTGNRVAIRPPRADAPNGCGSADNRVSGSGAIRCTRAGRRGWRSGNLGSCQPEGSGRRGAPAGPLLPRSGRGCDARGRGMGAGARMLEVLGRWPPLPSTPIGGCTVDAQCSARYEPQMVSSGTTIIQLLDEGSARRWFDWVPDNKPPCFLQPFAERRIGWSGHDNGLC